jgi:hypothetical protein
MSKKALHPIERGGGGSTYAISSEKIWKQEGRGEKKGENLKENWKWEGQIVK